MICAWSLPRRSGSCPGLITHASRPFPLDIPNKQLPSVSQLVWKTPGLLNVSTSCLQLRLLQIEAALGRCFYQSFFSLPLVGQTFRQAICISPILTTHAAIALVAPK